MAAWNPSLPWPGSPGGASSPHWGGYVRLFVRAAIASGNTFHMGAHPQDRLNDGNVLGGAPATRPGAVPFAGSSRLWVDLSCDVLDLDIHSGASSSAGIFTKADAATCVVTLADPDGIYDPAAVVPPFSYEGRSRLVPGIPVEVFAEVVNATTGAVTVRYLFTGTADSWREDWTTKPSSRRSILTASDATKTWVRYDRPEQPPVGGQEATAARIARLVAYYAWPGTVVTTTTAATPLTLQQTTLAASGWEQLSRLMDDELGVIYFTTDGKMRWTKRGDWLADTPPVIALGCDELAPASFLDTWDRPDADTLGDDYTILVGGTWGVRGNEAALLAQVTPAVRLTDYRETATPNGVLSFAWGSVPAATQQGIAFRIQDSKNYLVLNYTNIGQLALSNYVNGAGQSVAAWTAPNTAGTRFTLTLDGPTITLRNAGTGAVLGTTTTTFCQNETGVGLSAGSAMALTARWGDFQWADAGPALNDVLTDATPSTLDMQIRNVVRAAAVGLQVQTASDAGSVAEYGPYEYQRTDLNLTTNALVLSWAQAVVQAGAWPRIVLEDVTMRPGISPQSWILWPQVLGVQYVSDRVRIVWAPPDRPDAIVDQTTRVVGSQQTISRQAWTVRWQLAAGSFAAPPVQSRPTPERDLVDA